jgi:hypothetical protein
LLFQALDEKKECVGVYVDGHIIYDHIPDNLSKTWSFSSFLNDKPIEYAQIYVAGKSLEEVCPAQFREEYDLAWSKMRAFYKSFRISKINMEENCFFDLLPEQFVRDLCNVKNKITQYVFENYDKPENYGLQKEIVSLTTDISYQRLNVDLSFLKNKYEDPKFRAFHNKIKKTDPYIKYNPFGTKTGRLTTRKHSFPILTMDKKYRSIIKPNNDFFLELDYNAAELRVLIGLLGMKQPLGDIHDWNINNLYEDNIGREQAKKNIFSWLYNPNSKDKTLDKHYDRNKVRDEYWDGKCVKNYYKREIESDEYHSLNYIIQSTCSDLIMDRASQVKKMLQGLESKIAFIIHDSIVLDCSKADTQIINDVINEFSATPFGNFLTNVSAGKNFGEMKKICIQ